MSDDFKSWLCDLPKETFYNGLIRCSGNTKRRQAMLRDGRYTDLELQCEGQSIKCHRFVLVEYSRVFEAMFSSNFKEGVAGTSVEMRDIGFDALNKIISFLYDGTITIEGPDVMEILQFSDMYDVTPLRDVCREIFLKRKTPAVVMEIWQYAKRYDVQLPEDKIKTYCLEHFSSSNKKPQIAQTYGFLEADVEMICELLRHSELNVPDENAVFNALYDWLMYKKESRTQYTERLFTECIRAHTLDPQACRDKEAQCEKDAEDWVKLSRFAFSENLKVTRLLPSRTRTYPEDALTVFTQNFRMDNTSQLCNSVLANYRFCYETGDRRLTKIRFKSKLDISTLYQSRGRIYCMTSSGGLYEGQGRVRLRWFKTKLKRLFQCSHLLFTPPGQIYIIDNSQGLCITRVTNEDTWCVERSWNSPGLEVRDMRLSAYYNERIFMFEPSRNFVHICDTRTGLFHTDLQMPLGNDESCIDVITKGNLCFLVARQRIRMIYMDRLIDQQAQLEQTTEEGNRTDDDTQPSQESKKAVFSPMSDNKPVVRTFNSPSQVRGSAIYGQDLYILCILEPSLGVGACTLVFHFTNINTLLECEQEPRWRVHVEEITQRGGAYQCVWRQLLCTRT